MLFEIGISSSETIPSLLPTRPSACSKNASLQQSLAKNARTLVENAYDWTEIGSKFCRLVEEVAVKSNASPDR